MDAAEPDHDAVVQSEFARTLGVRIVSATPDEVVAELPVTGRLANRNGVMHGGAIMALADNSGGTATLLNLPDDRTTTTLESKTNFFRPIRVGDVATAHSVALHKGRTTMVWQTTITRGDGKVAAMVTQTQVIIDWHR